MSMNILIKITSVALIASSLSSCSNNRVLELSTIDFNKSSDEYELAGLSASKVVPQNGHYEIKQYPNGNVLLTVVDEGEKTISYSFEDEKAIAHINYGGLPLDPTFGAQIGEYEGKVSFMSISTRSENIADFIAVLKKKLGEPTEIISSQLFTDRLKNDVVSQLSTVFPNEVENQVTDEGYNMTSFPEKIIWAEDNMIYQLIMTPGMDEITNTLHIISKKAYRDRVFFGYHNPEKDSILGKYLK